MTRETFNIYNNTSKTLNIEGFIVKSHSFTEVSGVIALETISQSTQAKSLLDASSIVIDRYVDNVLVTVFDHTNSSLLLSSRLVDMSGSGLVVTTSSLNTSLAHYVLKAGDTLTGTLNYVSLLGTTNSSTINLGGGKLLFGNGGYLQADDEGGWWFTNSSNLQMFEVGGPGNVSTANNILDDSTGNMTVSGTLSVGSLGTQGLITLQTNLVQGTIQVNHFGTYPFSTQGLANLVLYNSHALASWNNILDDGSGNMSVNTLTLPATTIQGTINNVNELNCTGFDVTASYTQNVSVTAAPNGHWSTSITFDHYIVLGTNLTVTVSGASFSGSDSVTILVDGGTHTVSSPEAQFTMTLYSYGNMDIAYETPATANASITIALNYTYVTGTTDPTINASGTLTIAAGSVNTSNNTLDDGSGNVILAGTLYSHSSVTTANNNNLQLYTQNQSSSNSGNIQIFTGGSTLGSSTGNISIFAGGAANGTGGSIVIYPGSGFLNSQHGTLTLKNSTNNTYLQIGYAGMAFFGQTLTAQPSSTGNFTVSAAGTGSSVKNDTTYTGGIGSTAYSVGDVVKALKQLGLMAS